MNNWQNISKNIHLMEISYQDKIVKKQLIITLDCIPYYYIKDTYILKNSAVLLELEPLEKIRYSK